MVSPYERREPPSWQSMRAQENLQLQCAGLQAPEALRASLASRLLPLHMGC